MSKPIRPQGLSIFGFVEGDTEKVFLRHIIKIYSPNRKIYIPLHIAGGKNPLYMLNKASRVRGFTHSFDHSFILLDTDVPWPVAFIRRAKKENFELLGNSPCLESLFLSIVNPTVNHMNKSSQMCKREFKKNHMLGKPIITSNDCNKLFPKKQLDAAKIRIITLDRLIEIIKGNY